MRGRFMAFIFLAIAPVALLGCAQPAPGGGAPAGASSAEPEITDLGYRGEFMRAGPSLACAVPGAPGYTAEVAGRIGYQPCLHFGPHAIGMEIAKLEAALGKPARVLNISGLENRVYVRKRDAKVDLPNMSDPYLVAGVKNNRVVSLQMTGPPMAEPLEFVGVKTYSPASDLVARLGPPIAREPVAQLASVQGELWSYRPHPVSFEVIRNRIYSIRIALPGY